MRRRLPQPSATDAKSTTASENASVSETHDMLAKPRKHCSMALGSFLALCLCSAAASTAHSAEQLRPRVGEAYIFNSAAVQPSGNAPGAVLEKTAASQSVTAQELLDPESRAWSGATSIRLTQEHASVLLARDTIAYAGNAVAAAAAKTDGRIQLFGSPQCPELTMPQGHPAFALALNESGSVLTAWSQGSQELVSYSLTLPGCPRSLSKAPMQGEATLTVSPSGAYLAAHDSTGAIWLGPRDGPMKRIASLDGLPAAIAFSESEGVLLVVDRGGRGGIWSTRNATRVRSLDIAGGPFVRGDFVQEEARLWTGDGRLVRWDVLHQQAVNEGTPAAPGAAQNYRAKGWLELRGGELHFVAADKSWRPEPVYEPRNLSLDWSAKADCLRVRDLDGEVRYFSAVTGYQGPQCLADDWTPLAVNAKGLARGAALELRLFDVLEQPGVPPTGNSKLYCRVISETLAYLWTDAPKTNELRTELPFAKPGAPLQSVAVGSQAAAKTLPALPLRQGLSAGAPVRQILLK